MPTNQSIEIKHRLDTLPYYIACWMAGATVLRGMYVVQSRGKLASFAMI